MVLANRRIFLPNKLFQQHYTGNYQSLSVKRFQSGSVLILVQIVCKGYQQKIKVSKGRVKINMWNSGVCEGQVEKSVPRI